jgi:hypothetical protein
MSIVIETRSEDLAQPTIISKKVLNRPRKTMQGKQLAGLVASLFSGQSPTCIPINLVLLIDLA